MSTNVQEVHEEPTAGVGGQTNAATLFARSVRAEWVKLRSIRSLYGCVLTTIGLSALLAIFLAWAISAGEAEEMNRAESTASLGAAGVSIGQIAFLVLAALVITGEYSTGAIRSTLTAAPLRPVLLAAKAAVLAAVAAVVSAVSVLVSALVVAPMVEVETETTLGLLAEYVGYAVLGVGLFALMVLGLGVLIRSSAATITVTIAVMFVPAIISGMAANDTVSEIVSYGPGALQDALINGGNDSHSVATAGLLLAAWATAALVAGGITLSRRDA